MKGGEKNSIIEICPVRNVIARIGNKWAFLVIMILDEKGTVRFNEFGREIPDVSSRVLAGTLRMLEADGLISRKAYAVVPPRVEYSLTEMGRSLVPLINEMTRWALQNMGDIMEHRRKSELPDGRKE
ncbi:MAG: helix-turn-helix transcriptional regulator [Alistipes sp.]|nr:helix-turn-helix transcriptional regulator [Alistipes sp.]